MSYVKESDKKNVCFVVNKKANESISKSKLNMINSDFLFCSVNRKSFQHIKTKYNKSVCHFVADKEKNTLVKDPGSLSAKDYADLKYQLSTNTTIAPLVMAALTSFSDHYPLVLSPDDIYITILSSFNIFMKNNAELVRDEFVDFDGKKQLVVYANDFVFGDENNDWSFVVDQISKQIFENSKEKAKLLVSDFSTTTNIEKCTSEMMMMSSLQKYFEYRVVSCCGIPRITLLGTLDDWLHLYNKADQLSSIGILKEKWNPYLMPVLAEFIKAFNGDVDNKFWESFVKENGGSGGPFISGWINEFFPYNRDEKTFVRDSAYYSDRRDIDQFSNVISTVPFVWDYFNENFDCEFCAGQFGYYQDPETMEIKINYGYGMRQV